MGSGVFIDSYDSGPVDPDPFFLDLCGVEIRLVGSDVAEQTVWDDGTVTTRATDTWDWYDLETGERLLYQRDRVVVTDQVLSEVVDEEAGTVTVTVAAKVAGINVRLFRPHGGVVDLDVGLVRGTITIVIDLGTGEIIDEDPGVGLLAGSHAFFGQPGSLEQRICELLSP